MLSTTIWRDPSGFVPDSSAVEYTYLDLEEGWTLEGRSAGLAVFVKSTALSVMVDAGVGGRVHYSDADASERDLGYV